MSHASNNIPPTPKNSAFDLFFCFTANATQYTLQNNRFYSPHDTVCLKRRRQLGLVMGIVMKKVALFATTFALVSGSALAADLPVKAPPAPAFEPWDVAFGGALMNDYIFRGITQSNHQPSVAAYFEPRYNVHKDLQLYIGTSGESISFANRAAAEIDVYGGIRPTFGAAAFDFGIWGYLYPGGSCADNVLTGGVPGGGVCAVSTQTIFLADGNVMKRNVSFFEAYGKLNYTINDNWAFGGTETS